MADIVSRIYSNFRGVDFRGEEINLVRSPDSLNVWKDYKETESIRTRPELDLVLKTSFNFGAGSFDDAYQSGLGNVTNITNSTVWGVFFYNNMMLAHIGTGLYKFANYKVDMTYTVLFIGLNDAPSDSFVYEDVWYFKDGKHYLQYDGTSIKEIEGYIPTTSIARKPAGGGQMHQDINMLSDYRINTFLADGKSNVFSLDATNIDTDYPPIVKVDDKEVEVTDYEVDYENGKIKFDSVVSEPLTDGQDNVSVQFKKTVNGYKEAILNCTLLQVFDNRVFFSGNKDYPNTVWHCSLNDPSYVSDTDHYQEGDSSAVKGLVSGNNALWVFKEPSDANTTVFYHTPTIDDEHGKVYPSTHSSVTTGCVGKAINFNDDIVFFSERGMEGISGDVTTEQVVAHRSSLVDRKMIAETNYKDMVLAEWEGYLLVFIGEKVYLADSRTAFTNENHIEYEWFYWELSRSVTTATATGVVTVRVPVNVLCAKVHDGILYVGTDVGIFKFTDTTSDVESYWITPKDKFSYPHKLKTTNKRGCVVEATGDISVYAKTEGTDFELIGTYENITDYFVSRIKRKKFKDIQLKFHSKKRFSLETATLECFIGGYIKR